MKTTKLLAALLLFSFFCHAQETIQFPLSFFGSGATNEVYEATLVDSPPEFGTFYSVQLTNYPPSPYNPFPRVDVYSFENVFLYDDREVDYVKWREKQEAKFLAQQGAVAMADGPPAPGGGGGGTNEGWPTNSFPDAYSYTNGLWVEIADATNSVLLTLHHTEEGQSYDILVKTNLNQTSWAVETTLTGPAGTNAFSSYVSKSGRDSLFFMLKAATMSRVQTPFWNPAPGNYITSQTVQFFDSTVGATIRYTTNGAVPTTSDTIITNGASITITNTTQLKAKAWKSGMLPSEVATGGYTFYLASPDFSPSGGIYVVGQTVEISCASAGATIRFTTNNTEPSTNSATITSGSSITLSSNATVKAKAWKSSQESGVSSAVYQIRSAPSNDDVTNAIVISGKSGVIRGSNIGATTEEGEYLDRSIWYQWTAPTNGTVAFDLTGTDFETFVDVFEGYDWNDTHIGYGYPDVEAARFAFSATMGTTYKIAISTYYYAYFFGREEGNVVLSWTMDDQVATPTFSPEGGTYNTNQTVTVGCATANAIIHYTLNGTNPTENDPVVRSGNDIEINSSYTLKAKAWRGDLVASFTKTNSYIIDTNATNLTLVVARPVLSPASTNFSSNIVVTVSCVTTGATIYYTTNGIEPTTNDTVIASGSTLTVANTQTVKAKAWKSGSNSSRIQSSIYAKNNQDTDFDGIFDDWELWHGSDVFLPDADFTSSESFAHGLSNLQVFNNPSVLISDNYSTVNDNIPDWLKVKYGYSINDPSGANARGANGMTLAQSYQGGFNPTDFKSRPDVLPPLKYPDYQVIKGTNNHFYLQLNYVAPNIAKYQLICTVYLYYAAPTGYNNGDVIVVDLPVTNSNQRFFEVPASQLPLEGKYAYRLAFVDNAGRRGVEEFNGMYVPNDGADHYPGAFQDFQPQMKEFLKQRLRIAKYASWLQYIQMPDRDYLSDIPTGGVTDEAGGWLEYYTNGPVNQDWLYIGEYVSGTHRAPIQGYDDEQYESHHDGFTLYSAGISIYPLTPKYFTMTGGFTNYNGLRYLSNKIILPQENYREIVATPGSSNSINSTTTNFFVYQKTEQPILQRSNFFFSPSTLEAPAPNGQKATNEYPFVVMRVGQEHSFTAWAKEAIFRSDSVAVTNRLAFTQQYFDKAFLCGTNGDVPRTGTDNLAGKKLIDTSAAHQTGILSPYGDFTPTEAGKVILTTRPDTNGFYGECVIYVIDMQLDSNHDGEINNLDLTIPDHPFTFWVNNDVDREHPVDFSDSEEDDLLITDSSLSGSTRVLDYAATTVNGFVPLIASERDLEDYARLWIPGLSNLVQALPSGYSVKLAWQSDSGANLRLFKAAESDGGNHYLTNETAASSQRDFSVYPSCGNVAPNQTINFSSFFSTNSLTDHFIFCGATRGKGELLLRISDATGAVVGQTSASIQIKDIKEMYERFILGDDYHPDQSIPNLALPARDNLPSGVSSYQFKQDQAANTNAPYILFVHGWNMEPWEKDRFAETAFKRLYWQGYQGHFGSFRWATDNGIGDGIAGYFDIAFNRRNYDDSEFNAWRSAIGLKNRLVALNVLHPGKVYLLAHSMGNVVAGEALSLATNQVVNTYVASQAAVPAHTYDDSLSDYSFNIGALDFGPNTPNIYKNWFFNNSSAVGRRINFYNVNDFALNRTGWELNQLFKPNSAGTIFNWQYVFDGYPYDGNQSYSAGPPDDTSPWNHFFKEAATTVNLDMTVLTDRYEVMANAAQSRSAALGRTAGVGNLTADIDLARTEDRIWPEDSEDTSPNNYSRHKWHSAQFRSTNMRQSGYWRTLLSDEAFNLNTP